MIVYLQREIREGRRNVGALQLANLLQPDRFEEDRHIRQVRLRPPARPAPPQPRPPALSTQQQERRRRQGLEHLRRFRQTLRGRHAASSSSLPIIPRMIPPTTKPPPQINLKTAPRKTAQRYSWERRTIRTDPVCAEQVGFPLAAQAARLLREVSGRDDERVTLLTSAEPERLDAAKWLQFNRAYWGIENGLHQRLDVSYHDDLCRIRDSRGIGLMGMFRRLSNSLFVHWRNLQRHPEHQTTTDFHAAMGEEHCRCALRITLSKRPNFRPP